MFQIVVSSSDKCHIGIDNVNPETDRLRVVLESGYELFFKLNTSRPDVPILEVDPVLSSEEIWNEAYVRYIQEHPVSADFKIFFYVWQGDQMRNPDDQPTKGHALILQLGEYSKDAYHGMTYTAIGGKVMKVTDKSFNLQPN